MRVGIRFGWRWDGVGVGLGAEREAVCGAAREVEVGRGLGEEAKRRK